MSGRRDVAGLLDMVRPRITLLVGVQAAAGFLLERPASLAPLPWLVGGTLLVSAAGCALNHWLERDADARMERTARRPLATGSLSARQVTGFGLAALGAGLALLLARCPPLTAALEALAAVLYLGVYTPLKRRTSTNTWVGAIPGALPVLAGAAAAGQGLSGLSLCVFALVFLWQLPHFFAIASMYREQYVRGGLRVLSGDDPGDALLRWQMPIMVMSVLLVSMLPVLAGPARALYAATALLAGAAFLWSAFGFRARPERAQARRVVLASVAYLPLVLGALVVDVACVGRTLPVAEPAAQAPEAAAAPAADGSGLPVLSVLPEFELVDQDGLPLTRARLADGGDPWVVDFIFTSCAGICVPMTRGLVQLQQSDLPARYLSVSVDPQTDSPPVLAAFRGKWQGDAARWILATGSHAQIRHLGDEGFRLPVATGTTLTPEGYPDLFHSGRYALLDGHGRVRGTYEHGDSVEVERLRRDVLALRPLMARPDLHALLNGSAAVLLAAGWLAIRGRGPWAGAPAPRAHRNLMLAALAVSAVFLVSYVDWHLRVGSVPFWGDGWLRALYFAVLVPHVVLAAVQVPLIALTVTHAARGQLERHRRLARRTLPVWLFVSVSGVVVWWLNFGLRPA